MPKTYSKRLALGVLGTIIIGSFFSGSIIPYEIAQLLMWAVLMLVAFIFGVTLGLFGMLAGAEIVEDSTSAPGLAILAGAGFAGAVGTGLSGLAEAGQIHIALCLLVMMAGAGLTVAALFFMDIDDFDDFDDFTKAHRSG